MGSRYWHSFDFNSPITVVLHAVSNPCVVLWFKTTGREVSQYTRFVRLIFSWNAFPFTELYNQLPYHLTINKNGLSVHNDI